MKKFILLTFILMSFGAKAGLHLSCEKIPHFTGALPGDLIIDPTTTEGISYHVLVAGVLTLNCKGHDGLNYNVYMTGVGPGLEFTAGRLFLSCPTINKKRLHRNRSVTLGAVDVSATPGIGANTGVAINQRGAFCLLGGIQYGFGASVKIGYLEISTGHVDY